MSPEVWGFAGLVFTVAVGSAVKLFLAGKALRAPATLEDRLIKLQAASVSYQRELDLCLAENRDLDEKWYREKVGRAIADRELIKAEDRIIDVQRRLDAAIGDLQRLRDAAAGDEGSVDG
jgi:hypothetical protein